MTKYKSVKVKKNKKKKKKKVIKYFDLNAKRYSSSCSWTMCQSFVTDVFGVRIVGTFLLWNSPRPRAIQFMKEERYIFIHTVRTSFSILFFDSVLLVCVA